MTLRLLLIGDMHLGKSPRLTPSLESLGLTAADISPAAAWRRAAELAVEHAVHGVLLAGDVVNQKENCFEALAELRGPLDTLHRANIPVYAVAGNHDVEALPMLAQWVGDRGFHLLGARGQWEALRLEGDDGVAAELLGWSFPRQQVRSSPLVDLPPRSESRIPRLGLLHCDRDGNSVYAPVSSRALDEAAVDAWFLGHIHIPDRRGLAQSKPSGYLGCLSPVRSGETGWHGPWLASVDGDHQIQLEPLAGSPLRLEALEVDLSPMEAAPDELEQVLQAEIHRALRRADEVLELKDDLVVVRCDLRLVGAVEDPLHLEKVLRSTDYQALVFSEGKRSWVIDELRSDCHRRLDLEQLAQGQDPPAHLARLLLQLEAGEAEEETRAFRNYLLASKLSGGRWEDQEPLTDHDVTALLLRRCRRHLALLMAQKVEVNSEA